MEGTNNKIKTLQKQAIFCCFHRLSLTPVIGLQVKDDHSVMKYSQPDILPFTGVKN